MSISINDVTRVTPEGLIIYIRKKFPDILKYVEEQDVRDIFDIETQYMIDLGIIDADGDDLQDHQRDI